MHNTNATVYTTIINNVWIIWIWKLIKNLSHGMLRDNRNEFYSDKHNKMNQSKIKNDPIKVKITEAINPSG